jgi:hypothetical protein
MSAWLQVEDELASHAAPPPEPPAGMSPEPPDLAGPARPAWLGPLLMSTALILIAVFLLVVLPNALGAEPTGGCGGG